MDLLEPPAPPDDLGDVVQVARPGSTPRSRRRHAASTVRDIADRLLAGETIEFIVASLGVNQRLVYTVRGGEHTALTHQRRRALQAMYGVPRRRRSAKQRRREGMVEQAMMHEGEGAMRHGMLAMLSELKAQVAQMTSEMASLQEMMREAEGPMPVGLHPPAANSDGRRPWWAFWRRRG